ncbi:hypothetical protein AB4Z52_32605 [Rhizobium sp. 2YAF20]|uniref:hypothetical protein n=1 Tax=Rhizobium sp. 2YAF20 TaxID=3233027 RepID=UPI003F98A548
MLNRHLKRTLIFGLFAVVSLGAAASAMACAPADASLAGHYYLEGVTEVGSELLLLSDGSFEYTFAYGNMDQAANGCWSRSEDSVVLISSSSSFKSRPFRQLDLKLKKDKDLVFNMGNGVEGTYVIQ